MEHSELVDDPELDRADLYMTHMHGSWVAHRYLPDEHTTKAVTADDPAVSLHSLRPSADHRTLFASTFDAEHPRPEIHIIDLDAPPERDTTHKVLGSSYLGCLAQATEGEPGPAFTLRDNRWEEPTSARWAMIDASGSVAEIGTVPEHTYCPVRAANGELTAWAEVVIPVPRLQAATIIEHDGEQGRMRWPGCSIRPEAFTDDGARLALVAHCPNDERHGLWIIDVAALEPETSAPVHGGLIGPVRWSPGENLLAFTFQPGADVQEAVVRILRPADGALLEVPLQGASWPAWILADEGELSGPEVPSAGTDS